MSPSQSEQGFSLAVIESSYYFIQGSQYFNHPNLWYKALIEACGETAEEGTLEGEFAIRTAAEISSVVWKTYYTHIGKKRGRSVSPTPVKREKKQSIYGYADSGDSFFLPGGPYASAAAIFEIADPKYQFTIWEDADEEVNDQPKQIAAGGDFPAELPSTRFDDEDWNKENIEPLSFD